MENKKNNGFLFTWISCVVILLVLCFFGVSDSMKGTYSVACNWDPMSGSYKTPTGVPCTPGSTSSPSSSSPSSSSPSSSKPSSSSPSSSKPSSSSPSSSKPGFGTDEWQDMMENKDKCLNAGYQWVDGMCITGRPSGAPSVDDGSSGNPGTSCPAGQYSSVPPFMVCDSYSNGCYSDCHSTSDIIGGNTSPDKITGPSCGGSGNGWTVTSCVKFGNVWDNTSGCCEVVKVTEEEAASSVKTDHTNGSYTVTVIKVNGGTIKYNYNKDGKLMSIITTDSKGNQSLDTTENSNLNGSIINYYNNLEECNYMVADVNSYCVPYKGTYVTVTQARTKMTYTSEDECMQTTGLECEYRTYPDDPSKGYYMSVECDCEEEGDCLDDPEPNPGKPSTPTIKDPTDDLPDYIPEEPSGSSSSNPSSSSNKNDDRGEGCYKNNVTGAFKWFDSDPELNSNTKNYEKVNDSNCKQNVTVNPQTGEIAMFLIWIIAFSAVGYSVWYYMKSRKEES